jgi:hypothetical protein
MPSFVFGPLWDSPRPSSRGIPRTRQAPFFRDFTTPFPDPGRRPSRAVPEPRPRRWDGADYNPGAVIAGSAWPVTSKNERGSGPLLGPVAPGMKVASGCQ